MDATIRTAVKADLPAVLPMARALCAMHQSWQPARFDFLPDIVQRYASWLPQRIADPNSIVLVAELRERVIGFSIATVMPTPPIYLTHRVGWIHDLWVEPEGRRGGVGRALVQRTVERFAAMGVVCVRLETAMANEAVRSLLSSIGFVPSVIEMQYTLEAPDREHP